MTNMQCRYCAIYVFLMVLIVSCGSPLKTKMENLQPELDTAFYNKYIEKGPDNHLYPVFIATSSQREPSEKFGTSALMDGNLNTYWCSGNGLNTGEYIMMDVENLPATSLKVFIANDKVMARISTVTVIVNDSLLGNFPSGAPINLPKGVKRIKLIAGETDGLNEVKLPILNDSLSTIQVTKKNIISRYNSKSFGIAELEFYDNKGKKLPLKSPPNKKAIVQGAFNLNPEERFYLFDGNIGTSTQWFQSGGQGKLLLIFPDFTPMTKLRIFTGGTDYLNYSATEEISLQINGKKEQKYSLKMGLNEINLTEPLVARTFTLSFYKFQGGGGFGGISEIQGFDGARWYTIEPDSMYLRADRLRDSLMNTPIGSIMNVQVSYLYEYAVLKTDTVVIKNANEIPQALIDKRVFQKSTLLIRSNYTWEANAQTSTITYGKKVTLVDTKKNMFGDFKLASRSADQVVLNVRYRIGEQSFMDGKPGKLNAKIVSGKLVITKTSANLDGVFDMLISY